MDSLLVELASTSTHFIREMLPPSSQAISSYIDPGSGSLIVQILVASLVGGAFVARSYWMKIGARLRKLLSRGDTTRD